MILSHQAPIDKLFGLPIQKAIRVPDPQAAFTDGTNPAIEERIQAMRPQADQIYAFRKEVVGLLCAWWDYPSGTEGIWIHGPTGSGKSSAVTNFFARLQIPVAVINCGAKTKLESYLAKPVVRSVDGATEVSYELGDLALAILYGFPVLLDEGDRLDPRESSRLHSLMDGNGISVPELNMVLHPTEGFRVIVTANSAGGGDTSGGLHNAVQRQDIATTDRYIYLQADYPSQEVELAILEGRFPKLNKGARECLVKLAAAVRQVYVGSPGNADKPDALDLTISTRKLVQLAHWAMLSQHVAAQKQSPLQKALDICLLARASPETRDAITKQRQLLEGNAF